MGNAKDLPTFEKITLPHFILKLTHLCWHSATETLVQGQVSSQHLPYHPFRVLLVYIGFPFILPNFNIQQKPVQPVLVFRVIFVNFSDPSLMIICPALNKGITKVRVTVEVVWLVFYTVANGLPYFDTPTYEIKASITLAFPIIYSSYMQGFAFKVRVILIPFLLLLSAIILHLNSSKLFFLS